MSSDHGISLEELRAEAERLLADAGEGTPLDEVTRRLIEYAVCASAASLDLGRAGAAAERALDLGATVEQLHEVLVLVSGLGVHSLMEGSRRLATLATQRGEQLPAIDEERESLRQRYLGATHYWDTFETHVPGFLDAILRLSPTAFEGFMQYGALPSRTKQLPAVVKELLGVAVDATPTHRYMPGLRLHLGNALTLGAGRQDVLDAIDIAATAPASPGVR